MYEKLRTATQELQKKVEAVPKVGLVLGSGLGAFVQNIEDQTIVPYSEIPYFKETTVEGHQGRLIMGKIHGVQVAVLQGRLHAYEGYPMEEIVFPVRVLATLGIESLILTNASGGINENYRAGDLVLIEDHINLMGKNPLVGPNIAELGPRFPDLTHAYDLGLRELLLAAAKDLNYDLKTGVYCSLLGPTYETPAEIRMLRTIGADMVGMSTVPESIAANHLGIKVCGLSCVTNLAAGMTNNKLNHDEVKDEAKKVMTTFSTLLTTAIKKIGESDK